MPRYGKQFWRSAPFVRLLIPLTAGIVLARYSSLPLSLTITIGSIAAGIFFLIRFLSSSIKYQLRWLNGLSLNMLVVCFGIVLMYFQNIEHDPNWIGIYADKTKLISLTLQEPLTAKANSYKALAEVESVFVNG